MPSCHSASGNLRIACTTLSSCKWLCSQPRHRRCRLHEVEVMQWHGGWSFCHRLWSYLDRELTAEIAAVAGTGAALPSAFCSGL